MPDIAPFGAFLWHENAEAHGTEKHGFAFGNGEKSSDFETSLRCCGLTVSGGYRGLFIVFAERQNTEYRAL